MRVYIPATFDMLHQLEAESVMPIRSGYGFALTPALIESFVSGDEEEIDYFAFMDAALASIRLLATGDVERYPHRRVVITADISKSRIIFGSDLGDSVVHIEGALSLEEILAFHIDTADSEEATAIAISKIDEADLGDEDAELAVGDAQDNLMAWFDSSELALLTLDNFEI